jgi:hypothetical protein
VAYQDQVKTVEAVDGGTDAPEEYWLVNGQLTLIVPKFDRALK